MPIKSIRTFIINNPVPVIGVVWLVIIGFVWAKADERYPSRSELDKEISQVASHEKRITEVEASARVAAAGSVEVNRKLDETQKDVKEMSRQINRIVGAFEAKGVLQAQKND